jgi:NAD(P)-dependent dehydrogenase (short-subunit alcohol dehydrogenase family)
MHKQPDSFTENDIPDLTGYVAIVTGGKCHVNSETSAKLLSIGALGNGGIGYETAKQLALRNARVYIASRSRERVDQAIEQMGQSSDGKKLDLHFLQLDLQDLRSVRAAASIFAQQESRLDILINNAGVRNPPFKLLGFWRDLTQAEVL